jgi:hypothetical protein
MESAACWRPRALLPGDPDRSTSSMPVQVQTLPHAGGNAQSSPLSVPSFFPFVQWSRKASRDSTEAAAQKGTSQSAMVMKLQA